VNQVSGVAWYDVDPSALPYWRRQVVPGGPAGGVIATAAVDEATRRVYFGTAPGGGDGAYAGSPEQPQQPTFHALDLDTGEVAWQNASDGRASYAPTSAIPGVVFSGSVQVGSLRAYESRNDAGGGLVDLPLTLSAVASAPVVIDGTLLVGAGIGARDANPAELSDKSSREPSPLSAFCVPGTPGCVLPDCNDGEDNDGDGSTDSNDRGCVEDMAGSELRGDLDFDYDVDEADHVLFLAALGSQLGDRAYRGWADYDRDGKITSVDEGRWLAARLAYQSTTTTTTMSTTTTTTSSTTEPTTTTTTSSTTTTTTQPGFCADDPQHEGKCLICHRASGKSGETLSVGSERAVRAHLDHDDQVGACTGSKK
jgi:hypothetical protein